MDLEQKTKFLEDPGLSVLWPGQEQGIIHSPLPADGVCQLENLKLAEGFGATGRAWRGTALIFDLILNTHPFLGSLD